MGLEQHTVDLLEIDDARLITNGFEQRAEAQVLGATKKAVA